MNGDGVVDQEDEQLETQFSIWRQEAAGLPWTRIGSTVVQPVEEVETDIFSFTNYAICY